jgi:hypothetical protein
MEQHDCNESRTLFEIHAERSQNCQCFYKTLSHQKQGCAPVHDSIATKMLQIWQQNGDSGIHPNVAEPEKKPCCKIARFADAPSTM